MHHPTVDNACALLLVRIPMGLVGIYFSHRCLCSKPRKSLAQIRFELQGLHPLHQTAACHHFPFENNCQPQLLMRVETICPGFQAVPQTTPFPLPKAAHICRAAFAALTASVPTLLAPKGMGKGSGDGAQKCADGNVAGEGVGEFDLRFVCSASHLWMKQCFTCGGQARGACLQEYIWDGGAREGDSSLLPSFQDQKPIFLASCPFFPNSDQLMGQEKRTQLQSISSHKSHKGDGWSPWGEQ